MSDQSGRLQVTDQSVVLDTHTYLLSALLATPTLGAARKAGISCGSCHVNGASNPRLFIPGLSSRPGNFDTTSAFFNPKADDGVLDPVQQGFHEEHGLQCGFCTPGMMLTARALLDRNPNPTDLEIREAISGQICRCTGYAMIVRSIRWAADHPR